MTNERSRSAIRPTVFIIPSTFLGILFLVIISASIVNKGSKGMNITTYKSSDMRRALCLGGLLAILCVPLWADSDVPKHEPSAHLPPHNISLGHHRAPAPSMLYPASDIDWRFDSYMIVYMFQCHSPKSSHPLPLPLSPKVRYTHLCLFCCLAYRVIIAIFLNSIYMC